MNELYTPCTLQARAQEVGNVSWLPFASLDPAMFRLMSIVAAAFRSMRAEYNLPHNFQPAHLCTLDSFKTNASHLRFFHKESTDAAPLNFKRAMCLSNLFLYKATFTV